MVKIKGSSQTASPAVHSQHHSFVENNNENSFNDSLGRTPSNQDNAKLWDNDELVMKALRVYGKMPRPQVFNEISRVCKLSNLRKSRYFHEKMMKNNPFKDKILQLLAEEGEQTYPYFKIFFEEYKTKKQRLSLINSNENGSSECAKSAETLPKCDYNSVENSVDCNSNDFDTNNSNSDQVFYNNAQVTPFFLALPPLPQLTRPSAPLLQVDEPHSNADDQAYQDDFMDDDGHSFPPADCSDSNTDYDATANLLDHTYGYRGDEGGVDNLTPLLDTNATYLENLELKLKILAKEKEHMAAYFDTFASVIDGLKSEIERAGGDSAASEEALRQASAARQLDSAALKAGGLEHVRAEMAKMGGLLGELKASAAEFGSEQARLRAELRVTRHFADEENTKLQGEVDECRAQLCIRDEEIRGLKRRLQDSLRQNRQATARQLGLQTAAGVSRARLNEMKDSMDRLFAQIGSLTASAPSSSS